MVFVVLSMCLLCIPGLRIKKTLSNDYLNKNTTSSVTGIFVVFIFLGHVLGQMASIRTLDVAANYFFQTILSQMVVVPFLLFSGYGIIVQYFSQGSKKYLCNFPIHRILKIYFIYLFCEIFGCLFCSALTGFKVFNFTYDIFFIWNIGTHWYVFVILVLYILIFLVLLCCKQNKLAICVSDLVLSVALALFLFFIGKKPHWYNTIIAFPIGVLFGCYKDKIDQFLLSKKRNNLILLLIFSLFIYLGMMVFIKYVSFLSSNILIYLLAYSLAIIFFIITIIIFIFLFSFGNKLLITISRYSLFSYIIQGFAFEIFIEIFDVRSINIY